MDHGAIMHGHKVPMGAVLHWKQNPVWIWRTPLPVTSHVYKRATQGHIEAAENLLRSMGKNIQC